MSKEIKNVFISHVHEDDGYLDKLKNLLNRAGMEVRDSSISSDNPNEAKSSDYIKYGILADRISWASTVIVLISPKAKDSEWVEWEIEHAYGKDKRIVGVWVPGHHDCEIPEALDKYGDACVSWDDMKIIDAINGTYNQFETPDGNIRGPRNIKPHQCR